MTFHFINRYFFLFTVSLPKNLIGDNSIYEEVPLGNRKNEIIYSIMFVSTEFMSTNLPPGDSIFLFNY
jgi:hypothetical protein